MNEDFVSFDLAKKLKEKGFPQYTEKSYFVGDHKKRMCSVGTFLHVHTQNTEHLIAAPTIAQVLNWLREGKKMYIEPCILVDYDTDADNNVINTYTYWSFSITSIESGDMIYYEYEHIDDKRFDSYEQSAIAGIEYVIDNLI